MSGTLKGGLNYGDKGEEGSFLAASCFPASPSSSLHIERIIGQTGMNNSVDVAGQWGHFMFISLLGPVFWLLMSSIWGDGDSYVHPLRGDCHNDPIRVSLITRYWSEEKSFNSSFPIKM